MCGIVTSVENSPLQNSPSWCWHTLRTRRNIPLGCHPTTTDPWCIAPVLQVDVVVSFERQ